MVGREGELEQIDELLARARSGHGAVAVMEGAPGIGKTALLAEAVRRAERLDFAVARGEGSQLEREYAFGVVRQLFAPVVGRRSEAGAVFEGAARLAALPLGLADRTDEPAEVSGDASAAMHGLFWLTANLAERAPLLVAIDDAQWCDAMSARFALYLARRVHDLAVALLLVTPAIAEPGDSELLVPLGSLKHVTRLRPQPLTEADVGLMVEHASLPDPDERFVAACYQATRGNPFLVGELLAGMVADGVSGTARDATRVQGFTPEGIVRWVLARLGALGQDAQRLAGAFAVLGGGALGDAASLAAVAPAAAVAGVDELVGAHILSAGRGYAFVHPIVQAAVYDGLGPAKRAEAHALAARLCSARGAEPARVAAHLLASDPGDDAWVLEVMRAAAREASTRGAPASAARYLERALQEGCSRDARVELLLELGQARLQAGIAGSTSCLREALALDVEPRRQARILLTLAKGLFSSGEYVEARDALQRGLAQLPGGDDELALELSGWSIAVARGDSGAPPVPHGRLPDLLHSEAPGRTRTERLLLAELAYDAVRSGARPCEEVASLAGRALSGHALLHDSAVDMLGPYGGACYALLYAGEFEDAIAALGIGIEWSQRHGSRVAFGRLSRLRGIAQYLRGDLPEAMADLESARTTHSDGYEHGLTETMAFLALCRLERGDLAGAEAALELPGDPVRWRAQPSFASHRFACAQLLAARGELDEGLALLLECGQLVRDSGAPNPAVAPPWRSEAAMLAARMNAPDDAQRLVERDLSLARAFGAPYPIGVATRAAGLVGPDAGRPQRLAESEVLLERAGARLELARTLAERGASLRRGGQRREAREPLRHALDLATRCGAMAVARRAREELIAAGAKPRRERISGIESLTASELRVARLAAQGLTNRQIAQTLFITMRTVSAHLGHAYAKLDIGDRAELVSALSPGEAVPRPHAQVSS